MLSPGRIFRQFVSTFEEWHYLTAGFAVGVLVGIEYARRIFTE